MPQMRRTSLYYIEARTRTNRRTDVIIDFLGQQYIVELKIWRGAEYNQRGEEQLMDYLDTYRLKKGYMISFNFNKVLVNKYVGLISLQYYQTIIAYIIDTMPIATVSNIAQ